MCSRCVPDLSQISDDCVIYDCVTHGQTTSHWVVYGPQYCVLICCSHDSSRYSLLGGCPVLMSCCTDISDLLTSALLSCPLLFVRLPLHVCCSSSFFLFSLSSLLCSSCVWDPHRGISTSFLPYLVIDIRGTLDIHCLLSYHPTSLDHYASLADHR